MRINHMILLIILLLLCVSVSYADYIDNSNSRIEYAQSISALSQEPDSTVSPHVFSKKRGKPNYILVLFKTSGERPDFGEYEPEVLIAGPHNCFTAAYRDEEAAQAAIKYLRTLTEVIYAEQDGEVYGNSDAEDEVESTSYEQETEYFFHSSGASKMGFQKAVNWCKKVGEGSVSVAVIDSGVYPHSLLSSRLQSSGYDYVDNDADATNDVYGHGTHVAGIVVDCTPELPVYIKPIRVLNASGKGSIANTTSAIFEAAEAGCNVINLSLVSKDHSEAMEDAVRYALNCGSTVVVSAGNSGDITSRYCPVHMEDSGLIVVGACSGTMDIPIRASYSNYGPSLDVYAFGDSIRSCSLSGGFTAQSGTSQAAPHISALCAIMRRLFPSIGCGQLEKRIKVLAGDGEVNVPDASLLVPQTMGVSTQCVYLPAGTQIRLLQEAEPRTSYLALAWSCEDNIVATVDESGVLSCLSEGVTILHGRGLSKVDISAELHVIDHSSLFHIPSGVSSIESEAFFGTNAGIVYLPESVESIGDNLFGQTDIKTVIYDGEKMLFGNIREGEQGFCVVIKKHHELWKQLNDAGIQYIIDCIN